MRANACPSDKPEEKEREGKEKKRPRDEFQIGDQKGKMVSGKEGRKKERIRSNGRGRDFLLIYALKMPIDIYRYCHSRAARPVSRWLQPKLKLHFTMVFQVVAELSRNFNIPRRERLKIQTATCHSIATFHATTTPIVGLAAAFPASFSIPLAFISNPPTAHTFTCLFPTSP